MNSVVSSGALFMPCRVMTCTFSPSKPKEARAISSILRASSIWARSVLVIVSSPWVFLAVLPAPSQSASKALVVDLFVGKAGVGLFRLRQCEGEREAVVSQPYVAGDPARFHVPANNGEEGPAEVSIVVLDGATLVEFGVERDNPFLSWRTVSACLAWVDRRPVFGDPRLLNVAA